ncbi:glutamate--tRNA ligase [Cardinium endosymbiont of Sogatella furcifera]|uniref:glutamate--tRNA ligase n=1 Tax=Cardinium endosymbiont of Sogatella furcifera TaxID=650378 RepID=UPI000E0D22A5|nr:glutamate--tRNA ligase [Cardinium endosymbiont of Sogatella furcifera]AXI24370.1 glutamate--tRNA ligase [Cardinium endosymbiont of Sogatella furcifera]
MTVHVRFAPSPTGALHIGSVRTILYNYLLARKTGGRFILRMEDTDQKRLVASAEAYILESLRWLGIVPDEGPEQGGPFGPYRQSERMALYRQYIQPLLDGGHAYYAFDTPEEIEAMRERLKAAKVDHPPYNAISREWMRNGLTMPAEQVQEWIAAGKPYVIRLKVPHKEPIRFKDGVRGWVKVDTATLDDKVLMKSDGWPTYHLASVVDDHLMQITHVIRGEEWLPSTPIHILLYRYLGWRDQMPEFIHLPLLLAPNGTGKLSKRHADQYGFPAFPISWNSPDLTVEKSFREAGYLPEALWNFLALLGWNPGTHQEIFTKQGLIEAFSLERLGKSGVKFDIAKAKWFNQQHIKKQGPTAWANYFITEATKENITCSQEEAMAICNLVKDRVTFPKDFWQEGRFFFFDPMGYDAELIQKKWKQQTKEEVLAFSQRLTDLPAWDAHTIKQLLQTVPGIRPLLRMALTGGVAGPDLTETIALLGRAKTYKRIKAFILNGYRDA